MCKKLEIISFSVFIITFLLLFLPLGNVVYANTIEINQSIDKYEEVFDGVSNFFPNGDSENVPGYIVNWVGAYESFSVESTTAFTKFDLSSINGTVTSAKFKIYVVQIDGSPFVNLSGSNNDNWTEDDEITPSEDVNIITNDTDININTWKIFDVTSFVNNQVSGDKIATFVLTGNTSGDNDFAYCAEEDPSENPSYKPILEVTYTPTATITSVDIPADGLYTAGQNLDFTVTFDQNITVDTSGGTPYIPVTLDTGGTVNALYTSGSGGTDLLFRYSVQSGDMDSNGITIGNEIDKDGGALKNDAGGDARLTFSAIDTSGICVDALAPTLVSAIQTDDTHINVTLSEDCTNLTKADDGGFTAEETGTPDTTYAVTAIVQGADASHVILTVENMVVSAKEGITVKYSTEGNGTIQDSNGIAMATDNTGVVVAGWDTTSPSISSATLESDNTYLDITFNEGIYGVDDGSSAVTLDKLALTFTQNGGSATDVQISSVKKNDNVEEGSASALNGGETVVRAFMTVTGTPSGVETIEVKPADAASIYDKAGNPVSTAQSTGEINLKDKIAPTLVSAVRTDDTQITVNLSEDSTNMTKDNDGGFTVAETGNLGTTYAVTAIAEGADASHVILTVENMAVSAKEGITVKYSAEGNGTIQDSNGIAMATDNTGVVVAGWDTTSPSISSATLASDNTYLDITFNEGIYGVDDGSSAITLDKLALTFTQNGGSATDVQISSIKKNDNVEEGSASALNGGETVVRAFLTVTGTSSGVETIEVKPANDTSIYDKAGNAVASAQTTGTIHLNDPPPTLDSAERTDDTHILVTLNEDCTNISKADDGGFTVAETGNLGTTYAVTAIAEGADASHVILTVENMAVSAKEGVTVKYTAGGNGTIQDSIGNVMVTDNTGVVATGWDMTAPSISSTTLASDNTYLDITFDEGTYGVDDGSLAVTSGKLDLTFKQNGGSATDVQISSVKKNDNAEEGSASALNGGETVVRVFLTVTGTPSGVETIEVTPADATSIYDKAGNAVASDQTTGEITLNEKIAPTLVSAERTDDTHILITLSEDCTNISKADDGGFTVAETGTPGTTYTVTAIIQGVDASHVILNVENMAVSAKEGITVKYTAGGNGTIQDSIGNVMVTDNTGVVATGWDMTAPSISSTTLASDNTYLDITFDEGTYGVDDGNSAITLDKLALNFAQNGGSATNVQISSVKKNDNEIEGSATALIGGETVVRVFLTVTGTPSGMETIEVKPADATSIYDKAGNAVASDQTTGEITLIDQRVSSGSGGSNNTWRGNNNQPSESTIVAPSKSIDSQSSKSPDGQTIETFTINDKALEHIKSEKTQERTTIQFNISSTQTAITHINIPTGVLEGASNMNISISTPKATLLLPATLVDLLSQAGQNLNINITRGGKVDNPANCAVLGSPTAINTDIKGNTQVTIPLDGITIPTNPQEREAFLASLAVFTIHSDGEKEIINADIIYDTKGNPVSMQFSVDKFSTFAIVKMSKKAIAITIDQALASINDIPFTLDAKPFIDTKANRTLVPLRFISEALGAKVEWLPKTRQVIIKDGEKEIILTLDKKVVYINGNKAEIDCEPVIVPPGRTFLPLRFVSENLGAKVLYEQKTRQIIITKEY